MTDASGDRLAVPLEVIVRSTTPAMASLVAPAALELFQTDLKLRRARTSLKWPRAGHE